MPEDNYVECMKAMAETLKHTKWVGEWYGKCLCIFRNVYVWILAAITNKHVQFYCSNENFKITSYTLLFIFQSVSIADMYISSGR